MAFKYYAHVLNQVVKSVHKCDETHLNTILRPQAGKGAWIECDANTHAGKVMDWSTGQEVSGTPLRKNYPSKGYTYDAEKDAFIPPRPYDAYGMLCASWTLNDDSCQWIAPSNPPNATRVYKWKESNTSWEEVT